MYMHIMQSFCMWSQLIMAALCNRAGHYIFILWFLLFFPSAFSSNVLSRRKLDIYNTSTHDVALVQI